MTSTPATASASSPAARIRAGDRGRKNNEDHDRAWYATDTDDWHASGELLDGSLAWNGMTVNRVVYFPDTDVFRLNDPRDRLRPGRLLPGGRRQPGAHHLGPDGHGQGVVPGQGPHREPRAGTGFNFEVPEAIRTVLDGIATGDEITIAVSVPE